MIFHDLLQQIESQKLHSNRGRPKVDRPSFPKTASLQRDKRFLPTPKRCIHATLQHGYPAEWPWCNHPANMFIHSCNLTCLRIDLASLQLPLNNTSTRRSPSMNQSFFEEFPGFSLWMAQRTESCPCLVSIQKAKATLRTALSGKAHRHLQIGWAKRFLILVFDRPLAAYVDTDFFTLDDTACIDCNLWLVKSTEPLSWWFESVLSSVEESSNSEASESDTALLSSESVMCLSHELVQWFMCEFHCSVLLQQPCVTCS